MFTDTDSAFIGLCLQGFFYGLYSGIFAIYLQSPSKESKTAMIIFNVLCLLYVLSTATVVCDFLNIMLQFDLPLGTLSPRLQIDRDILFSRLQIVQAIVIGCCDFISQFILIYRCWIVWGKKIRIVIIPSFLAITFIATWLLASRDAITFGQGQVSSSSALWRVTLTLIALAASMTVNILATGLIVFKILKVFLEVKATLGATKLRHIIFIIIESGMAVFAIQLVRVVLTSLLVGQQPSSSSVMPAIALNLIVGIHQMANGIAPTIIFVRASMRLSEFDDEESDDEGSFDDEDSFDEEESFDDFKEADGNLHFNNPPLLSDDPNTLALRRVGSGTGEE